MLRDIALLVACYLALGAATLALAFVLVAGGHRNAPDDSPSFVDGSSTDAM